MIIGTAGHIDHGKTALVRALTGVDTDRLPEEKRRGITIALGFAPLVLDGVGQVGVVDVPGHEGFVRTMLAGASGVDCALLVIAADEGVMPQTREHVAILRLLGISRAVVALTKADLADDDLRALVSLDVRDLLAATPYADAPIVAVSATTGAGLGALRAELVAALKSAPPRSTDGRWRLPVDRVFSVAGAGTVVTGTAWSGAVSVGDAVRILPGDRSARVRSIESHGRSVERSEPGARTALALVGLERDDVPVGAMLAHAHDAWRPTRALRATIHLLDGAQALGVRTRVQLHVGTAEVQARVVVKGGRLTPGVEVPARISLDAPLALEAGDRFVLRGGSPLTTIGGGVVTDPLPLTPRARPWVGPDASTRDRLGWMLEEAGALGLDVGELPIRLGISARECEALLKSVKGTARVGARLVSSPLLEQLRATLVARVEQAHRDDPLAPGLDLQTARAALSANDALADEVIRRAERAGVIEVRGAVLRSPGYDPAQVAGAGSRKDTLLARLREAGAAPPSVNELRAELGDDVPALLKLLERERLALPVALDRWFAASAVDDLLRQLREGTVPGSVYSPAELRELLQVSRKYLIPFLEWCDRKGISRRSDAGRSFPSVPSAIP